MQDVAPGKLHFIVLSSLFSLLSSLFSLLSSLFSLLSSLFSLPSFSRLSSLVLSSLFSPLSSLFSLLSNTLTFYDPVCDCSILFVPQAFGVPLTLLAFIALVTTGVASRIGAHHRGDRARTLDAGGGLRRTPEKNVASDPKHIDVGLGRWNRGGRGCSKFTRGPKKKT